MLDPIPIFPSSKIFLYINILEGGFEGGIPSSIPTFKNVLISQRLNTKKQAKICEGGQSGSLLLSEHHRLLHHLSRYQPTTQNAAKISKPSHTGTGARRKSGISPSSLLSLATLVPAP